MSLPSSMADFVPCDHLLQKAYFASHSFLIGAASVEACNVILDHLIQALGRWTSHAYQFISAQLWKLSRAFLVSWLDVVCLCNWLSSAPLTLLLGLYRMAWGLYCSFWCFSHCQLPSFGKGESVFSIQLRCLVLGGCWSRRSHLTPVRWPLLFKHQGDSDWVGARSRSCHGYLLLMLEQCPALPTS